MGSPSKSSKVSAASKVSFGIYVLRVALDTSRIGQFTDLHEPCLTLVDMVRFRLRRWGFQLPLALGRNISWRRHHLRMISQIKNKFVFVFQPVR